MPNIIDNTLDEAQKTGEYYEKRLNSPEVAQQIKEAFDQFYELEGDEKFENFDSFISSNMDKLPMYQIIETLKTKNVVSCERQKIKKESGGRTGAIGNGEARETLGLGEILSKDAKEENDGKIVNYLIFQKVEDIPLKIKVSRKIVEYPPSTSFLPERMVFIKENPTNEEIKKIMNEK